MASSSVVEEQSSPLSRTHFPPRYAANRALESALQQALSFRKTTTPGVTPNSLPIDWAPHGLVDWDRALRGETRAAAIYIRSGILQKSGFCFYLGQKKRPETEFEEDEPLIPETWLIDVDCGDGAGLGRQLARVGEVSEQVESTEAVDGAGESMRYVLKKSVSNCGRDVHFFARLEDVGAFLRDEVLDRLGGGDQDTPAAETESWVLQRYVPPLLLEGRKFHLRVLVCVSGDMRTGGFSVWVHLPSVAVLLARKEFPASGAAALGEMSPPGDARGLAATSADAHLTNFSLTDAKARLLSEMLPHAPQILHGVLPQILHKAGKVFSRFSKKPLLFCPLPNQFELFGLDGLVDAGGEVLFLELNSGPEFGMYDLSVAEGVAADLVRLQERESSVEEVSSVEDRDTLGRKYDVLSGPGEGGTGTGMGVQLQGAEASGGDRVVEEVVEVGGFRRIFEKTTPLFGTTCLRDSLAAFEKRINNAGRFVRGLYESVGCENPAMRGG